MNPSISHGTGPSTSLGTRVRIAEFRRLHEAGCFVMPNPWDIGSARILVALGFPAIATTSAGMAWSLGRRDNEISLDIALAHLRAVAGCVEVPVNADFEDGFAPTADAVADHVAAAATTGVAGLSIEDSTGNKADPLYAFALAVDRVRAARRAIDASGTGVLLTGRSEGFISGRPELPETIKRLVAYADAGADCLYAPGVRSPSDIEEIVRAVAPKPVNVLVGGDYLTVAQLTDLGVRRISVGGALARAAWTGFLIAAREIAAEGTFTGLGRGISVPEMNGLFGGSTRHNAC